jgi:hypothetical protein
LLLRASGHGLAPPPQSAMTRSEVTEIVYRFHQTRVDLAEL